MQNNFHELIKEFVTETEMVEQAKRDAMQKLADRIMGQSHPDQKIFFSEGQFLPPGIAISGDRKNWLEVVQ
jgi:hypothetical protein